jgi:hypothetical protein
VTLDSTAEFRWHRIQHTIQHDAQNHFKENPDITEDDVHDAAWEYADSHQNLIYTHRTRMIWVMCDEVQEYESDEISSGFEGTDEDTIDKRMAVCVYLAHQSEFAAKLQELIEKRDTESDSDIDLENIRYLDGSK